MCEGRFFTKVKTSCQRTGPAQTQLLKASISNGAVTAETGREWFKRHIVEGQKENVAVWYTACKREGIYISDKIIAQLMAEF